MSFSWFKKQKPWLNGGIIGVGVCILLFVLYLAIYWPLVNRFFLGPTGEPSDRFLIPVMATGHIVPLLSIFYSPYVYEAICPHTALLCTNWTIQPTEGCVPWTMEGYAGCCIELIATPTTVCTVFADQIAFWGLALLLIGVYFVLGAGIGYLIGKRKPI